jgi:uncharacterized protein (DUF342 family)
MAPNPPQHVQPDGSAPPTARLEITDQNMTACLVLEPGLSALELEPLAIEGMLLSREVRKPPDLSLRIAQALDAYRANPSVEHRSVLARGERPVHAVDDVLELDPDLLHEHAVGKDASQPDGVRGVDHHARSALHVVFPGQRLGRIVKGPEPRDGVDVFGQTVPARQSVPLASKLDPSVRVEPSGDVLACVPGLLEHAPSFVRVERELRLHGGVDFTTGNVDFPGDVTVEKGVRDCFVVRAGFTLRISGLVEAATLHAGEDCFLDGMAARNQGGLTVGRDLAAHYLSDVTGTIGRDLSVAKEIAACALTVGRRLHAGRCTLVRGELRVADVCELGEVGSDAHVTTDLVLGHLPDLERRAADAIALVPRIRARADVARQRIAALSSLGKHLPPSEAEELTSLQFHLTRDQATLRKAGEMLYALLDFLARNARPELLAHSRIFPGVRLWMGKHLVEFTRELRGPARIGIAQGEPAILSPGPTLKTHARVVVDDRFLDLESQVEALDLVRPLARLKTA